MRAEMTELVMPGDANPMGTAFGGRIMQWIDIVAAIAAQRAVGAVVTASVDNIEFKKPIRVGDVVTLKAGVNKIWNTSMEVGVQISFQTLEHKIDKFGEKYYGLSNPIIACHSYLTFVAINENGERRRISSERIIVDGSEEWRRREEEAEIRRVIRLSNKKKGK